MATAFDIVSEIGSAPSGVTASIRYDGAPVLKVDGIFVACLAIHQSAEADRLIVRAEPEECQGLLDDAPEIYYTTDYHRPHPVVLVRLRRIGPSELRELLRTSWRIGSARRRKHS